MGIVNSQGDLSETPCLPGYEYEVVLGSAGLYPSVTITKSPEEEADLSQLPAGIVRMQSLDGGTYTSTCDESTAVPESVSKVILGAHTLIAAQTASYLIAEPSQTSANSSYPSVSNASQESFSQPTTFGNWNQSAPPAYLWSDPKAPYGNLFEGSYLDVYPLTFSQTPTPTFGNPVFDSPAETDQSTSPSGQVELKNYFPAQDTVSPNTVSEPTSQYVESVDSQNQTDNTNTAQITETQNESSGNEVSTQASETTQEPAHNASNATDRQTAEENVAYAERRGSLNAAYGKLNRQSEPYFPTFQTNDGRTIQTSPYAGPWIKDLNAFNTPKKFGLFEDSYFGRERITESWEPPSDELRAARESGHAYKKDGAAVIATDTLYQDSKIIERRAYDAVRIQGDIAYGTKDAIDRVAIYTGGKVKFDEPDSFPDEVGVNDRSAPSKALTPLSSQERAKAISIVEQEVFKYPKEFWDNAKQVTIYTYGARADMRDQVRAGGFATIGDETTWIEGKQISSSPDWFATSFHHELAHQNDPQIFPSHDQFCQDIYGSSCGKAYAGKSGLDAILSGKLGSTDVKPGFANKYGEAGGIWEDKATIVQSMFTDYPALEEKMKIDPILREKVGIAKAGFLKSSGGLMDETYWKYLPPIAKPKSPFDVFK